jgi:hypothetical protein
VSISERKWNVAYLVIIRQIVQVFLGESHTVNFEEKLSSLKDLYLAQRTENFQKRKAF